MNGFLVFLLLVLGGAFVAYYYFKEKEIDDLYSDIDELKKALHHQENINEHENEELRQIYEKKEQAEKDLMSVENDLYWICKGFTYDNEFCFYATEDFKNGICENNKWLKDMVKIGTFWELNGKGWNHRKEKVEKIAVACFNYAADMVVAKHYKKTNQEIEAKLRVEFERINRLLPADCDISLDYFKTKLNSLWIKKQYETTKKNGMLHDQEEDTHSLKWDIKKQKKTIRESEKELKEARELILSKSESECEVLRARIIELQKVISESGKKIEKDEKKIKGRAGYVYVVSSPSFNRENQFKIGLTRRSEPIKRINELSESAGLPFTYNVHSIFHVDDCFQVEGMLHDAFRDRIINERKEHFLIDLKEVEAKVKEFGHKAEFVYDIEHQDYKRNKERLKRIGIEL